MLTFIGYTVFVTAGVVVGTFILEWVFNQKVEWSFVGSALGGLATALIMILVAKFYWEDQGRNVETIVYTKLFFTWWIAIFIGMPLGAYLLKKAAVIEENNERLKMFRKVFRFSVLSALISGIGTGVIKFYLEDEGYNIETIVYIKLFLIWWLTVVIAMALGAYLLKKTAMDEEVIEE